MVSKFMIVLVAVLIVVIAIAGIAIYYYNAYHKLTFQLSSVSLGTVTISSIQTNFFISIHNPNALPIYIPNGNFQVYINNQDLGKGKFDSLTIAGNSQSEIKVPVTFSASNIPSVISGLITGGGTVNITVQGTANLGLFSVPFSSTLYNPQLK